MTVTWSWDLQAYISAAWTSIARDVEIKRVPLSAKRGINGSGINDRVAAPGVLSCALDNDTSNSGGKLGYYSPAHANMRANFGRNTKVRLKFTYGGVDYYKFYGYITDLQPTPGQYRDPSSTLTATDYMQRLLEYKLQQLPVQENQRSDQIVATVLASLPTAPLNQALDTDTYYLLYALTQEQDEKTTVMGVLQKLCQSVLGYFYIKGNTTDGETAVFELEKSRAVKTSSATLNNTMTEMETSRSENDVKNKLVAATHPIRVDAEANAVLYSLESEIRIPAGQSITVNLQFRDPASQASRISGKEVVTPLQENVHFKASTSSGGGNDSNASLNTSLTVGANAALTTLENTGGVAIHVNFLNLVGRGIYFYNPVELIEQSGDADKVDHYDFFYLSDQFRATQFLKRLHARASADTMQIESVSFFADESSTLMGYAMTLDIGSRVTVIESATGLNGEYTINRVEYLIETNGTLRCTWGLEPADTSDYFVLDSSLLDGTDVLSPY